MLTASKNNDYEYATIQGVILAAGRGSRLASDVHNRPKCLSDVGGRALIDHQLARLTETGIRRICVIAGYGADGVREALGARAGIARSRIDVDVEVGRLLNLHVQHIVASAGGPVHTRDVVVDRAFGHAGHAVHLNVSTGGPTTIFALGTPKSQHATRACADSERWSARFNVLSAAAAACGWCKRGGPRGGQSNPQARKYATGERPTPRDKVYFGSRCISRLFTVLSHTGSNRCSFAAAGAANVVGRRSQ